MKPLMYAAETFHLYCLSSFIISFLLTSCNKNFIYDTVGLIVLFFSDCVAFVRLSVS